MKIITICPKSFASNCYALISGESAFVVDPSVSADSIINAVSEQGATVEGILLTHGHFDHIISLDTLRARTGAPAMIHKEDAPMLSDGKKNAFFTFFGKERSYAPAEILLEDDEELTLGEETIRVIHTPGHSPGSVCYLCEDFMLTGDTLFAESIGRCDLWGGNHSRIVASLESLDTYDRKMKIYSGHGLPSLLGDALDFSHYFRQLQ